MLPSVVIFLDNLFDTVVDAGKQVFQMWTVCSFSLTVNNTEYTFTLFDFIVLMLIVDVIIINTVLDDD